jgi:YbbR domain-containing protein
MMEFLRKYVFHNFWMKLASLVAAVLLWLAVARDPRAEIAITTPIEFYHMPDNLEISTEHIPQAQIRVRGPARRLSQLGPAQVRAVIDLQGTKPGERTYDLNGPEIRVPHGIDVVQVVPTQVRLAFDQRVTRELPVQPRVVRNLDSEYRVVEASVVPPVVTVVGPEKRVDSIDNAFTDPVDTNGVAGRATFTTHVYVPDPMVRVLGSGTVRVTVTTQKATPERNPVK